MVFVAEIIEDLHSLDEKQKTDENPMEFKKRFNEIIEFHTEVKELSVPFFF